jgi:hypothetical protein
LIGSERPNRNAIKHKNASDAKECPNRTFRSLSLQLTQNHVKLFNDRVSKVQNLKLSLLKIGSINLSPYRKVRRNMIITREANGIRKAINSNMAITALLRGVSA